MNVRMLQRGCPVVAGIMAIGVAVAMAGPASAVTPSAAAVPTPPAGAPSTTFGYDGETVQSWTVPAGVGWVKVSAIGGAGGMNNDMSYSGSSGAEVTGTLKVAAGDQLLLSVAGAGGVENGAPSGGGPGGWGGLGAIGGEGNSASDDLRNGGSGGGASTVQLVAGGTTTTVMVAGGGGGQGGGSGDPTHIGRGGNGGESGAWTGGAGSSASGPFHGHGGAAGAEATAVGGRGSGGSGLGGNGGSGGGGVKGGAGGTGAGGTSAGGGGGAGSSMVDSALVQGASVAPSGVHWDNPVANPFQDVPNGSITVTEIPLLATTVQLAVQNPQVAVGENVGPLSAVIPTMDGYAPSGAVTFYNVTNGNGSNAQELGTADVSDGVAAIPSVTFTAPGVYRLQADWSGDENYAPESSAVVEVTVTSSASGPAQAQQASGTP